MRLWDDAELLAAYATQHAEEAFATLVERHVSLVYSSALRQVRDPHLAEEITQVVFIILARKGGSLKRESVLAGWLCRTARFVACNALKTERRRQYREQEAYMNSHLNEPEPEAWSQITPWLDEAVAELSAADRNAIVLRYYQQKPLEAVGKVLGLSADSAQKRVARALDKLRASLLKRGVTLSAAVIAGAMTANSVQAAPAAMAKTITAVAMTKGVAAGGSTLTLLNGAMKLMAWTNLKTATVIGVAVILAAGTTTLAVTHHPHPPSGPIPQNAWAFAKYATPEASFQSSLWAMSKGDVKIFSQCLTPEFQSQYLQTAGKGKSEKELAALDMQIASMIGDFQVIGNEAISSDEAILHFRSSRMGNASVPMKKIQGEWKICGNITPDGPNKGGH